MDTKEKIIRKGLQNFILEGYNGTSISKIAKRVGIAKPTMYNYFASKEELFEHSLAYYFTEMGKWSQIYFKDCDDIEKFVDALFNSFEEMNSVVASIIDEENGANLPSVFELLITAGRSNTAIKERIALSYKRTEERIETLFQQGVELGQINPLVDSKTFAILITTTVEGLMLTEYFNNYEMVKAKGLAINNLISTHLLLKKGE